MSDVQVQTILSGGLWSSTWRSEGMAGARGGAQSQAQDKDHQLCEVGAALIRIQAADTYQTLKLPVKGGAHVQ